MAFLSRIFDKRKAEPQEGPAAPPIHDKADLWNKINTKFNEYMGFENTARYLQLEHDVVVIHFEQSDLLKANIMKVFAEIYRQTGFAQAKEEFEEQKIRPFVLDTTEAPQGLANKLMGLLPTKEAVDVYIKREDEKADSEWVRLHREADLEGSELQLL